MEMQFFEAVANRRSYYAIGKEKIVPEDKIQEIVNVAVKHIPSSFNSQTGRVVILFNKNHLRLWEIVKEELRKMNVMELRQEIALKIKIFVTNSN